MTPDRQSKCVYKHRKIDDDGRGHNSYRGDFKAVEPSRPDLPFFTPKPDREYDQHYCGCFGWD